MPMRCDFGRRWLYMRHLRAARRAARVAGAAPGAAKVWPVHRAGAVFLDRQSGGWENKVAPLVGRHS